MRNIKVAAIQQGGPGVYEKFDLLSPNFRPDPDAIIEGYVKERAGVTLALLEEAGREGCGIVCTGEDIAGINFFCAAVGYGGLFPELARRSTALLEPMLSDVARKYGMHVVACYSRPEASRVYNAAVVYDGRGNPRGEYRKTHLPPDETWQITPGDAIEPIELEFGTIGVCICYDIMFPECAAVLALKGAEMLFHPTAGYGWYDGIGEATLRARASDNGVTIVTAKNYVFNHAGKSSVIDPWGHVLADAGFGENVVVSKTVDLDRKKTQPPWYNPTVMSGEPDVVARMRRERRPELYAALCAPVAGRFVPPGEGRKLEILGMIREGKCRW